MNISPAGYNDIDAPFFRDAKELFEQIQRQVLDKNEKIGVIVDVGCGSGKATKFMADTIPHDRILALDIDPDMVEASRLVLSSSPSVDFFLQDISQPWENLDRKLRDVEGQVDIVVSNLVLHWINHSFHSSAVSNILRLLRPGGRVYFHVVHIVNFNEFLPEVEKERNEKLLKIPSREEQEKSWKDYFTNAGLGAIRMEYYPKYWEYKDIDMLAILKQNKHMLATFLPADLAETEKRQILEELGEYFKRSWATTAGSRLVEKIEPHHKTYYYSVFRITGQK